MLYADSHLHTNPLHGYGAGRVAKKFKKEGGWFIALVSLPPHHYGFTETSIDSYRKTLDLLVREAAAAREEGLSVVALAGFHPSEVDEYLRRGLSKKEVYELAVKVLDLITDYIGKGLIHGIGEVGRQHYGTSPERLVLSETIMIDALELACQHSVPVHLHLEQGGWATAFNIAKILGKISCKSGRVLLHHVNYETGLWSSMLGLPATLPVKTSLEKILAAPGIRLDRFLVESDFIDDPKRPGVSAYPWEIPRFFNEKLERKEVSEEAVFKLNVDNVSRIYGVPPP
uniref:Hydrolase TatD n=1 Tax=Thermosphaera aggregans TaxID=54254 RepID=A0A7C2FHK0_9CREN